ncbi:hypothetical protein ACQUY5_27970 [Bacillus cereus]|uniref:hypothetical protein n=1 Tax=Bacillus cereus TaxID=1396 RepID=UPI003D16D680
MRVCSVEGCSGKHRAKGYCIRHYRQYYDGNEVILGYRRKAGKVCKVEGCNEPHRAKGFCLKHYDQDRYIKKPSKPIRRCTVEGCTKVHRAKGLCSTHYYRNLNNS